MAILMTVVVLLSEAHLSLCSMPRYGEEMCNILELYSCQLSGLFFVNNLIKSNVVRNVFAGLLLSCKASYVCGQFLIWASPPDDSFGKICTMAFCITGNK